MSDTRTLILCFLITACALPLVCSLPAFGQESGSPTRSAPQSSTHHAPDELDANGTEEAVESTEAEEQNAQSSDDSETESDPVQGISMRVDPSFGLARDQAWIFIDKSERRMVVNDGRGWREAYRIALGQNPQGDKRWEGDGRTPEGEFYICRRIIHNRFHRFLLLSYPDQEDAQRARQRRRLEPIEYRAIMRAQRRRATPPMKTWLGGNIGIHGYGRRRAEAKQHASGRDWTDGCIAVTNEEIERIFNHIHVKTHVLIVP